MSGKMHEKRKLKEKKIMQKENVGQYYPVKGPKIVSLVFKEFTNF